MIRQGRNKTESYKLAYVDIRKRLEYIAYRRKQWFHLAAYSIVTASIVFVLSFFASHEARTLSGICITSCLMLTVYGICIVMKKPNMLQGRIISMEPKKLIWLKGREGHSYFVQTESGICRAECMYGRTYGVEGQYGEGEMVWLLLFPSPYIVKLQGEDVRRISR